MIGDMLRVGNDVVNRWEARHGRLRPLSLPEEVLIEPTNKCNSRCVMCLPYRRDPELPKPPQGFMERTTLERVGPILRWARKVLLTGFGEPLLHPEFLEMLRWVKARAPYAYFFTNGLLIDENVAHGLVRERADLAVFSMGGATPETFEKVRGVRLEPVLRGLRELARAREQAGSRLPRMAFNVVAMNSVLPELHALVDLAKKNGVESVMVPQLWVETATMSHESVFVNPEAGELFEDAAKYAESVGVGLSVGDFPPRPCRCIDPYRKIFIAFNGDVFPCAHERHLMGNVREDSIFRIWHSKAYRNLRLLLRTSPEKVCPGCPEWVGTPESFMRPAKHFRGSGSSCKEGGKPQTEMGKRPGERAAEGGQGRKVL